MATQSLPNANMGRKLRELREGRGLKREHVALALDMGAENWRHYEAGRTQLTITMLPALADLYGITVAELVSALLVDRTESDTVVQNSRKNDNKITANYVYTDGRRIEARVTRSVEYASARGTRLQHVSLGLPMAAGMA